MIELLMHIDYSYLPSSFLIPDLFLFTSNWLLYLCDQFFTKVVLN